MRTFTPFANQPTVSGGTVTYEGQYEILSLSGSFLLLESGNQHTQTGGLSISLVGPGGTVFGGGVSRPLVAKSPVQVILWSFVADEVKEVEQINPSAKGLCSWWDDTGDGSGHPSTSMQVTGILKHG
ncbi:AT-hook motif nuclear-localized protein 10-like isoform X2 [Typha latifolia]|uniref:AT-hook motif nuclear-localized protein 10-like isoform X2 n=1 Tax=Typha latifolia TaxID=4733 RepID=UPI003C2CCC1A